MEETVQIPEQVQETQEAQQKLVDPYELIVSKGGPTKDQLIGMKLQTPNGKLKIFTPDGGKRLFILRAIGHMELAGVSRQLAKNLDPDQRALELETLVVAKCTVWTNTTANNKIASDDLKAGAAGLSSTLSNFITWMSDYVDPQAFEILSSDL